MEEPNVTPIFLNPKRAQNREHLPFVRQVMRERRRRHPFVADDGLTFKQGLRSLFILPSIGKLPLLLMLKYWSIFLISF